MRIFLLFFSLLALFTPVANAIEWRWVGESSAQVDSPFEAFNLQGKPNNLVDISDRLDAELLADFYGMVPEGKQVDLALLNSSFDNISIKSDLPAEDIVTVKVAFLNEGAGYKNALGYFIYDTDNRPSSVDDIEHVLLFPNSSKRGSGGLLESGEQIDLNIELTAGQTIGFFINSNGWDGSYGSQKETLKFGQPFYTLASLNPNVGLGQRYHVVFNDTRSEAENEGGFFAFGFEDILTAYGDKDFNDLIFNVEVTPISAVEGFDNAEVLQSVNDRIETKVGVLAFEDNWPLTDDYDFNDAVISYQIMTTHDGDNNNETIKSIKLDYKIQAIGATFHNGFALRVPGLTEDMLASVVLTKTLQGKTQVITRDSQVSAKISDGDVVTYPYPLIKDSDFNNNDISFSISEDLFEELSTFDSEGLVYETANCLYNTTTSSNSCPEGTTSATIRLMLNIKSGVLAKNDIAQVPFDHYLFGSHKNDLYRFSRKNEGEYWFTAWQNYFSSSNAAYGPGPGKFLEIHLKEFASGTGVFEEDLSVSDYPSAVVVDAQNHYQGNPFISLPVERNGLLTGNLPWVLDLPVSWQHPAERIDIAQAYPNFVYWLEDNNSHQDWYFSNVKQNALFNQ